MADVGDYYWHRNQAGELEIRRVGSELVRIFRAAPDGTHWRALDRRGTCHTSLPNKEALIAY